MKAYLSKEEVMKKEYLLDTNTFFNILKAMNPDSGGHDTLSDSIEKLKSEKLIVSLITKVEIISVLGKYARGIQGGLQKCNCQISKEGDICQNSRYFAPRKKWNSRRTKAWIHFITEILEGRSKLLFVAVEPFDTATVSEAQKIILHALSYNFASMDAMIAATAKMAGENERNVTVITSDKSLKACLSVCGIPYFDLFSQA